MTNSQMSAPRRLLWGIGLLAIIAVAGVIGCVVIEDRSFVDSLYMTIITITTIGYAKIHPLTASGKIFSILLIVGGVSGALFALIGIVEYIIAGYLQTILGRR